MYAPGGLYLPHFDALDPIDVRNQINLIQNIFLRILLFKGFSKTANGTWVGNRIATAMFYVSLLHNYFLFIDNLLIKDFLSFLIWMEVLLFFQIKGLLHFQAEVQWPFGTTLNQMA